MPLYIRTSISLRIALVLDKWHNTRSDVAERERRGLYRPVVLDPDRRHMHYEPSAAFVD